MADTVEKLMLGSFLLDMPLHFDHLPELVSLAECPTFAGLIAVMSSHNSIDLMDK